MKNLQKAGSRERRRNFIPQSGTNTKLRAMVAGRMGKPKVQAVTRPVDGGARPRAPRGGVAFTRRLVFPSAPNHSRGGCAPPGNSTTPWNIRPGGRAGVAAGSRGRLGFKSQVPGPKSGNAAVNPNESKLSKDLQAGIFRGRLTAGSGGRTRMRTKEHESERGRRKRPGGRQWAIADGHSEISAFEISKGTAKEPCHRRFGGLISPAHEF